MLYNDDRTFEGLQKSLTKSVFVKNDFEHVPSPTPSSYHLATDNEVFLLTDDNDYLTTK